MRTALVGLFFVLIGTALAIFQGLRSRAPIKLLAWRADQIARGDLEARVEISSGDEIGMLGENFNYMADRLLILLRETAEKATLEKELEVARTIQETLVPPAEPVDAARTSSSRATTSRRRRAAATGGRCTTCPTGAILVVIGDVTGHGVPSAMITAAAKAACDVVRATEGDKLTVTRLLEVMNRAIFESAKRKFVMTCFASILDPKTRTITYANAGHNFPYLFRPGARRRQRLPGAHVARQSPRRSRGVDLRREDAPAVAERRPRLVHGRHRRVRERCAARSTAKSASAPPSAAPPSSTRWRCARASSAPPDSSSATARARTTSRWCSPGLHHDPSALRMAARLAAATISGRGGRRRTRAQRGSGRTGSASPGEQSLLDGAPGARGRRLRRRRSEVPRGHLARPEAETTPIGAWPRSSTSRRSTARPSSCLRSAPEQTDIDAREQLGLTLYKTANPPPAESCGCSRMWCRSGPTRTPRSCSSASTCVKSDPKRAAPAFEIYLKYRPASAANLDPQIHNVLGTAYLLAKDYDAAQKEFEGLLKTKPNDMTAKLMLGAVLVGKRRVQPGHLALRAHPRRGVEAAVHLLQPRHLLPAREARRRCGARGRAVHQGQAADAKGHVLLVRRALRAEELPARAQPSASGGAAGPGQRHHQGQDRPHLPRHEELPGGRDLPRAGGGRAEGVGADKDPEMLGALAEAYAAVHAPKDKLNSIGDELASLNKDPRALATAGQVYFLAGNDERAMRRSSASLALEPNNAGARAGLVKVLNRRAGVAVEKNEIGRTRTACLSEAVKLSPDDLMTNRNLGLVLLLAQEVRRGGAGAAALAQEGRRTTWSSTACSARAQLGAAQDDGGASDLREGGADGAAHARARSGGGLRRARADLRRGRASSIRR